MMDSEVHDVLSDGRRRRSARWLVMVGFAVWSAGLALWELSWGAGLTVNLAGGAALTYGLGYLAQGSADARSPSRWC